MRRPALLVLPIGFLVGGLVTPAFAQLGCSAPLKAVPVVYVFSGDPVAAELTDSLARPNRNLTGISLMSVELMRNGSICCAKWLLR